MLKDLHWTSVLIKQGASYELTQPLSLLDNWLPVRSEDASSLALRSEVLLPAFQEALDRLTDVRGNLSKRDQHICILTVLLTGYVILEPYFTTSRPTSEQQTRSDLPFYTQISQELSRLSEAEIQWHSIKNTSSIVHGLVLDNHDALDQHDSTPLTQQSPLQILAVDPALRLADLADYRPANEPPSASAAELLVEAAKRTLTLSEVRIVLDSQVTASDVQVHEMVRIAEENSRLAFEMIRRCASCDSGADSTSTTHIGNIFTTLGSHLPPNDFRSRDLFCLLSNEPTVRSQLVQLSLPIWLARSFDHIRSSHRYAETHTSIQDGDHVDENLINRDEIPRMIHLLVGFMDQTGLLQDVQAANRNDHAERSLAAEVLQNLAIEIKVFAVDMVKYKPARDLYKRLI